MHCVCVHVCIHICVCVLVHLYSSVHVELTDKGDGRELKLGLSGSDMLTHMALTLSLSHSGRGLASVKKKDKIEGIYPVNSWHYPLSIIQS